MSSPHDFDAFYVGSRQRLLLQTWALTSDLPAARRAVRDAYVVAWHRWSKLGRPGDPADPEDAVRPWAWASAQRRSAARPWRRERGLPEDVRANFDALHQLSTTQRRVLVLHVLAGLEAPAIARELALVPSTVERELASALQQFSVRRSVPPTSVRGLFDPMAETVAATAWPRVTIIRRSGTTRRRVHVAAGAVLTTAALVASGFVVTDTDGLRPSLQTERLAGPTSARQVAARATGLEPARLLSREQASRLDPDLRWRVRDTTDNTAGDGIVLPCQTDRFADPEGQEALVRRARGRTDGGADDNNGGGAGGGATRTDLTQMTEMSADAEAAGAAYRRTQEWFAACGQERVQLLATEDVDDVGDAATLFVLRSWADPVTTYTVGVSRSGRAVTTLVRAERGAEDATRAPVTTLLASAVNKLCGLDGIGFCAGPPSSQVRDPLPAGPAPGMLSVLDLPPAGEVDAPWVGTDPAPASVNVASTRCDETRFDNGPITEDLTRTFVAPDADLPPEFGLTETVGLFPRAAGAEDFVTGVRDRMAGCEADDLGAEVEQLLDESDDAGARIVWRVRTEVSENRSVEYLMGFIRNGRAVGQVGFVPADGVTLDPEAFASLVERAQVRLGAMPGV